jgi:hypothetical protein
MPINTCLQLSNSNERANAHKSLIIPINTVFFASLSACVLAATQAVATTVNGGPAMCGGSHIELPAGSNMQGAAVAGNFLLGGSELKNCRSLLREHLCAGTR